MIYDTAGVIDDAEEQRLERAVHELYREAGVAIVVLAVPRLADETIDELAVRAGQTWGVGKRGEDRGLVVAFAREDRKIFVATGYGTEGYLPDGRVGGLLDRYALPHLREDRFSQGLVALVDALVADSAREFGVEITGAVAPPPEPASSGPGPLALILGGIALVVFLFVARRNPALAFLMLGSRMFGRGGGVGGFGGGFGSGGFAGGGFGGGGAGRSF
jgi:uncharacterized protein